MFADPSPAHDLMNQFAAATGLTSDGTPRRYLWTDAFAVCNWLGLGEVGRARDLAGSVHQVLGRHRPDDPRTGWISGLPEGEGAARPTAGGLRIGKPLPERGRDQPYHPQLEWERDGQYFHYLTRWMRALKRLADVIDEPRYHGWSVALARVAFDRFSHGIGPAPNRLHWKMSIDLSRPLVPSMGQHDPLDGYVVMSEIRARGATELDEPVGLLAGMGEGSDWVTADPLGAGALLTDAWFLARLPADDPTRSPVLERVVQAATLSLREVREAGFLDRPASQRLAFRELGLAIGLAAVDALVRSGYADRLDPDSGQRMAELRDAVPLRSAITSFWLEPDNQRAPAWVEHEDISTVMLATAVHPTGYLDYTPDDTSASG